MILFLLKEGEFKGYLSHIIIYLTIIGENTPVICVWLSPATELGLKLSIYMQMECNCIPYIRGLSPK